MIDIFKEIFDVGFDGEVVNFKKITGAINCIGVGFTVSISIRAVLKAFIKIARKLASKDILRKFIF